MAGAEPFGGPIFREPPPAEFAAAEAAEGDETLVAGGASPRLGGDADPTPAADEMDFADSASEEDEPGEEDERPPGPRSS